MTTPDLTAVSVETLLAPLQTISHLAAEKAGKLADIQINAWETYLSISIHQCRAASAVKSPEDLKSLADKQTELFRLLGEKAIMDLQRVFLLGTEFGAQVQSTVLKSSQSAIQEIH